MTKFHDNFDGTKPFSDTGMNSLLVASTALTYTVPGADTMKYRALFGCSSNAEIWVKINGAAVVPVSNVASDSRNQEFVIPGMARYVIGGDTLSFISTGTPQIGVSLLLVENNS